MSDKIKVGEVVDAVVFKITDFGAFCSLKDNKRGLIHISQVSDDYVKDIAVHLKVGDSLKAKIMRISPDGKIDLTLRNSARPAAPQFNSTFEEKLKKFLMEGEERLGDLKKSVESKQK